MQIQKLTVVSFLEKFKYKIDFLSNCDTVVANSNDTLEKHIHDVDPDHSNSGQNFK